MGVSEPRCQLCGKHPAIVHFTEVEGDRKKKLRLCRPCAEARGVLEGPTPAVQVQELVVQLTQTATPAGPAPREVPDLRCPGCGLSYAGFQKVGRLGCAACYTAFEAALQPLLRKIHAHVRHVGKAPRTYARKAELRSRVDDLRQELDRAVRGEDYERAARVRDEIRDLEAAQSAAARAAESGAAPEADAS